MTAAPRSTLLFVVQGTASMAAPNADPLRQQPGSNLDAALAFVRRTLQRLASLNRPVDVAVLLYQGDEDNAPQFDTLLPRTAEGCFWRSADELAQDLSGPWQTVWPWHHDAPKGRTSNSAALAEAYLHLREFLTAGPPRLAPVVVHLTDGSEGDAGYPRVVQSLRCLATESGRTTFVQALFTSSPASQQAWPGAGDPLPEICGARWLSLSSRLPKERRAWVVNACPFEQLVKVVAHPPARLASTSRTGTPWQLEAKTLVLQAKQGNTLAECEDACDVSRERLSVAVSDGAGSGIYSHAWASLLCRTTVPDTEVLDRPDSRQQWLADCQTRWLDGLHLERLSLTKQHKITTYGTGATLVTLRIYPHHGRPDGGAAFLWHARAVGDSCLFWIRGDSLRATFPLASSTAFGLTPELLRTLEGVPDITPAQACGLGQAGDFFLLATDALAQMLLLWCERGEKIPWEHYWGLTEPEWTQKLHEWRARNELVNDDCTLLGVRVLPRT